MSALDQYLDSLDGLIRQLSPAQSRALTTELGKELRRRNARRIKINIEPAGGAMKARKRETTRLLRKNETIKPGQKFMYLGRSAQMRTIKTPKSAAAPSRSRTQSHDSCYIWGWDYAADGIRKFRRDRIELPSSGGAALKRSRMFQKIHRFSYLKQKSNTQQAQIGYLDGLAAYIAAAHQYGEDNRPARELLGFAEDDLRYIQETVIRHLAQAE